MYVLLGFFNPKWRKTGLPFVLSTTTILTSQDLYACSSLQMNDGNRYALLRSVDEYFERADLHLSLLSVVFHLMLFFFLVGKVVNQCRFPHKSDAFVLFF